MADGPSEPFDTRLVRRLAAILTDTGLTEIEVERGDLKIRVARSVTMAPAAAPVAAQAYAPVAAPAVSAAAEPAEDALPAGELIKSPMVGTVYLAPQPGASPFVKVGDRVNAGQTLLIIEAMKTMNPIAAPRAGKVLQLLVGDAQPVEYGEPLVVLE